MADGSVHSIQQGLIRQTIACLGIGKNKTAHDVDFLRTHDAAILKMTQKSCVHSGHAIAAA
jgi:hypothetical protein